MFLKNNINQLVGRARKNEDNFWRLSEHKHGKYFLLQKLYQKNLEVQVHLHLILQEYTLLRGAMLPKKFNLNSDIGFAYVCILSKHADY